MIKRSCGFTLIETIAAMAILLLCLGLVAPMIRTTKQIWNQTSMDSQNKELLAQAVLRIAPTIRNGLMTDTAHSTSHQLVVITPYVDPVTKTYVFPLTGGDSTAFYLSDTSGDPKKPGTILWRSVNGTPDKNWSLRSGKGRLDLGTSNLTFSYDVPSDPSLVTVSVYSTQWNGNKPVSASANSTILLRNHQIGGL